ncbi:unnamed protein product, partial [Trichobilharzia regenti]
MTGDISTGILILNNNDSMNAMNGHNENGHDGDGLVDVNGVDNDAYRFTHCSNEPALSSMILNDASYFLQNPLINNIFTDVSIQQQSTCYQPSVQGQPTADTYHQSAVWLSQEEQHKQQQRQEIYSSNDIINTRDKVNNNNNNNDYPLMISDFQSDTIIYDIMKPLTEQQNGQYYLNNSLNSSSLLSDNQLTQNNLIDNHNNHNSAIDIEENFCLTESVQGHSTEDRVSVYPSSQQKTDNLSINPLQIYSTFQTKYSSPPAVRPESLTSCVTTETLTSRAEETTTAEVPTVITMATVPGMIPSTYTIPSQDYKLNYPPAPAPPSPSTHHQLYPDKHHYSQQHQQQQQQHKIDKHSDNLIRNNCVVTTITSTSNNNTTCTTNSNIREKKCKVCGDKAVNHNF